MDSKTILTVIFLLLGGGLFVAAYNMISDSIKNIFVRSEVIQNDTIN